PVCDWLSATGRSPTGPTEVSWSDTESPVERGPEDEEALASVHPGGGDGGLRGGGGGGGDAALGAGRGRQEGGGGRVQAGHEQDRPRDHLPEQRADNANGGGAGGAGDD